MINPQIDNPQNRSFKIGVEHGAEFESKFNHDTDKSYDILTNVEMDIDGKQGILKMKQVGSDYHYLEENITSPTYPFFEFACKSTSDERIQRVKWARINPSLYGKHIQIPWE